MTKTHMKRYPLAEKIFAGLAFVCLLATAIVWSDPDPERAIPTAESVTALGHSEHGGSQWDKLYQEHCRKLNDKVWLCR